MEFPYKVYQLLDGKEVLAGETNTPKSAMRLCKALAPAKAVGPAPDNEPELNFPDKHTSSVRFGLLELD